MFKLSNSIGESDEFYKKTLNWYTCGPTVYNRSHLGHARTYLTIDLIIRTMRNFGYEITHMINITDIDDKILHQLIHQRYTKFLETIPFDRKKKLQENMIKGVMIPDGTLPTITQQVLWIQKHYHDVEDMGGITVEDYFGFVRPLEKHFWDDLDRLGVQRPDVIQRVTDNIEAIINYIQKIMDNNYAYESNGSVYFRTECMKNSKAKVLAPDKDETDDFTTQSYIISEKRHKDDFVLWKKSKPFEIAFPSPWGDGRPGWHIECSTMINEIFGSEIDVHAGGIDLKFPHHHNEYLQSTAHSSCSTWANWWIHTGHLLINDEKMSQSLGNFTTIDKFLETGGDPNFLRMVFLLSPWDRPVSFTQGSLTNARQHVRLITEFIDHTNHLQRINDGSPELFDDEEKIFLNTQRQSIELFEQYLKDNFNSSDAIAVAINHIHKCYKYGKSEYRNSRLIIHFGNYIKKWMEIWGFKFAVDVSIEKMTPLADLVVRIRDDIRNLSKISKTLDSKQLSKVLFNLSDRIRDVDLKKIGIQIQDTDEGEPTKWILK